ncbi:MAG: PAS domain-containing protein, partial [Panacagrimonas sp.]
MPPSYPGTRGAPHMTGVLLQAWHAGGETLGAIAGPMLEPVLCSDREGRFLYANDAALRALDLFGGPPVSGYRLIELCAASDALRITAHDRAVLQSGESSVRDERFAAAGYAHHWQVTRLPLRDPDGCVRGLLSLWIERRAHTSPGDAAARRDGAAPEEELRANAERFRHLVETLGDVYWILDYRRMRRLYVSPACERLWELPPRVLYAGTGYWLEHVYREDREQVEAAFAELAHGRDFVCEYRIVRGNGSLAWVRDRAVAVFDQDLAVDRVIGVCEDISEQRDLVSGMLERERRLDLALGASGLHVWTFDADAHRLSVAPSLCNLLGLTSRRCMMPGVWRRQVHADNRVDLDHA